jgi:hypothetical protein
MARTLQSGPVDFAIKPFFIPEDSQEWLSY